MGSDYCFLVSEGSGVMEVQHNNSISLLSCVARVELTCMADLLEDATPEDLSYPKDALFITREGKGQANP